jgi:ABC-type antimicrobial peptide transport system permease subunit
MAELDYDPDLDYAPEVEPEAKPKIAPAVYRHYVDVRRSEQHYQLALLGGIFGAAVGLAIWLGISLTAHAEAEWTAIGVGFLAGIMVRVAGKGFDRVFGVLAAMLTAIGCFVAILVSGCHFMALKTEGAALFDALSTLTPETFRGVFTATFNPMDGVFYGIALILAFRIAYRRMSNVERAQLVAHTEHADWHVESDAA